MKSAEVARLGEKRRRKKVGEGKPKAEFIWNLLDQVETFCGELQRKKGSLRHEA